MINQATLINGVAYSWSDISLTLFGVPVVGILAIEWKRKQIKTNNYGVGSEPVSRGYGRVDYEASIEIYQEEWQNIKLAALAIGGDVLNIGWFDIIVKYGNNLSDVRTTTLKNCEFTEDTFSAKEGDTKLVVKLPLIIGGLTTATV
jgi:hypothetical protein